MSLDPTRRDLSVGRACDCECHCQERAAETGDPRADHHLCAHEWRADPARLMARSGRPRPIDQNMLRDFALGAFDAVAIDLAECGDGVDDDGVACARCGAALRDHHLAVREAAQRNAGGRRR